jgi:uncharacterized membrane-anchored protein YhcB (DUF1043 family)
MKKHSTFGIELVAGIAIALLIARLAEMWVFS